MNTIKKLLGVTCYFVGIFMFITFPQTLIDENFSSQITDSTVDKIFFFFMTIGAGMVYFFVGYLLLRRISIEDIYPDYKKLAYFGFLSMCMFIVGIYYHTIFGSPW